MKKQLLALAAVLASFGSLQAVTHHSFQSTGVTDKNYNYKYSLTGATVTSLLSPTKENAFSAVQTLPFSWNFCGQPVTQYMASDNGFITFNTSETLNPTSPMTLPSTGAPKNAIFAFWNDLSIAAGSGVADQVYSYTVGTAPNRMHVIQWLSVTNKNASGTYTSFAIRIMEGKGFEVILNQVGSSLSGIIGVNNADGTDGYTVGNSLTTWATPTADDDYANMIVHTFRNGPQPANNPNLVKLNIPRYELKNENVSIKGTIKNWGSTTLTSFKLHYEVDGVPSVILAVSGVSIPANGGSYDFTHNAPYSSSVVGDKIIHVWITDPNNDVDGDNTDNDLTTKLTLFNNEVPRKVLHEIFTSSTCPPCKPGNETLKGVLDQYVGGWNTIKYQVNFPSTGDPYYTSEVGTRFAYYDASFAPWLVVDGNSNWGGANANANYYTTGFYDNAATKKGMASLTATYTLSGKTVTVSGTATPVNAFSNTQLKLRIAIIENPTSKNIKTNGETTFYNVMKKMLPDANGTAVNFTSGTAVNYSQSFTFPGSYRLPADGQAANIINLATENSVEEFGNLSAIVFLQDDEDNLVWNSIASAPAGPLGINEVSELGLTIYPNPAKSNFNITFGGKSSNGTVRILDMNGQVVLTQDINSLNGEINCDKLINGLYFVELTVDGKTAVKKLNIIR